MKTYFIGDVHGCYDELNYLLGFIAPLKEDRVIFVGDLINKGPYSREVVQLVVRENYECIMGNHEAHYIKNYLYYEKYIKLYNLLSEEEHKYLLDLPDYIDEDDFTVVHAGLVPGKELKDTPSTILHYIRTWDGLGKDLKNPSNPPWYELYREQKKIVYGHWAARGLNIRSNTIGLDSGCVYGNYLSAWCLETGQVFKVRAGKAYERI